VNELNRRLHRLSPEHRRLLDRRLAESGRVLPSSTPRSEPALPHDGGTENHSRPTLSLLFFSGDARADDGYRLLLESARLADKGGFEAVWLPERHFQRFGGLYPSPSVLAGGIATVTDTIGIRAGSVVAPLHDPVRIAEEWAVVDNLSGGRAGISFATGWHPGDFALAPEAFHDRRQIMYRTIDSVRALWRGESIARPDGSGSDAEVTILPRPVQPELPTWVTASSTPQTWLRAAEIGAGVLCGLISQGPDTLVRGIRDYRHRWRECGHPGTGHVTLMLHTFVGHDEEAIREQVRRPLSRYLETFLNQFGSVEEIRSKNPGLHINEGDADAIIRHAFNRHFDGASLLGGLEKCQRMLAEVAASGVDEIACLVDFGIEAELALDSLALLAQWVTSGTLACRTKPE
jgi:natural product biosynthesis luciferase-like monooxygenase protein